MAVLSLFGPALLRPGSILYPTFSPFSDLMVIHWPKARLMADSWQAGLGLPLWTPLILSGMPLAANQLAMLFYPPAWLFLILPVEPVFNLLFVFHLFWGGSGVYLWLRLAHRQSKGAALVGSLVFALNGKWLAHVAGGHVSLAGAIGWMPWAWLGLQMFLQAKRRRPLWAGLVIIALAIQIFTHTLPLIYTAYLLGAMVVWHHLGESLTSPRRGQIRQTLGKMARSLLALAGLGLAAGLVGAVQLWPLVELARFSNRALSLEQAAAYALSPLQLLIGLLLPSAQGGHELVIYLGLIPLLLAVFGLSRRRWWSWFYGMVVIFAAVFALGPVTPLHPLFYHFAPGFGWVRTPARMFFVGGLALAPLVGFGIDRLARPEWRAGRWFSRWAVGIGAAALLVGLGLAFGFGQINRAAMGLALLIPAGLALIWLRGRGLLRPGPAIALLGLLLFIDLASFDLTMMRFIPLAEALEPGRKTAQYLTAQPGLFRVYSPSYSLPTQTAAAAGLQLADGVEPVHLAAYDRFMARAGGYDDPGFSVTLPPFGDRPVETALREAKPDPNRLGRLNVRYIASAFPIEEPDLALETKIEATYIYRNEAAMPRAWLIPGGESVRVTHYSPDLIELETETTEPALLVLSEIWYPGWQATVNGASRPVAQVDNLLRGVALEQPGRYQVRLAYRPRSVIWGRRISILTALLLAAGLGLMDLKKLIG